MNKSSYGLNAAFQMKNLEMIFFSSLEGVSYIPIWNDLLMIWIVYHFHIFSVIYSVFKINADPSPSSLKVSQTATTSESKGTI